MTEILERAASKTQIDVDGKRRNGKRIIARALWEIATTGRTTLPRENGTYEVVVNGNGWFDVVKWLYQRIDGPPQQLLDVTTQGQSFAAVFREVLITKPDETVDDQ